MLDVILYLIFRVIYYIINFMPDKVRYLLGKALGYFVYYAIRSRREITLKNLKNAFKDSYTDSEITALCKKVYRQMGLTMVEFMILTNLTKEELLPMVDIEGQEYLEEAYKRGQGIILYTAHFGNWEWLVSILPQLGYPVNAIARTQDNPYFDNIINEIRTSKGVNIIPRGMSVRQAFKALKQGELLFILGDQNARNHGWAVDFFGRTASVFPGAVQLASRTGAVILPVYLIRKDWGKHCLKFYPPAKIRKGAGEEEQRQLLIKLNKDMEKVITEHPEQWLWMHRRWNNKLAKRG